MSKYSKHSDIGGYTLLYADYRNGDVLCAACANLHASGEFGIYESEIELIPFVHWEGESMHCDHCNAELMSEYGNPWED